MSDFYLNQGAITAKEKKQAFRYLTKHKIPVTKKSLRHQVSRIRKRNDINRYLKGREEAATDPSNPWQVIYGNSMVGGTITFIHTTGTGVEKDRYLHLIVTLAAHEITFISNVYFDGFNVTWNTDLTTRPTGVVVPVDLFAGFVKMQVNYGSDSQTALSQAVADTGGFWTSNHRQRGHAHVYLQLKWDETIFKNGLPDFTFFVRGKYDITDTRTGTNAPGAQNTAMILNDYLKNSRWGLGISSGDINTTRLNTAITGCEDGISLAGGGTENRYLINSHFGTDEAPGQVVEDFLAGMAGRLTFTEGKWNIYAGVARTPGITINENHILSDLQVITKAPRSDNFNSVRGTFVSTQNNWEESDFPVVSNSTYITEDNSEVIYEDLTFAHVKSHTMVQRLAKIELEAIRQGITVEFTGTMHCYQAEPGEWVYLTFSRFGWSSKIFEVVRSSIIIDEDESGVPYFAVKMTLRETASGVYDWNSGNETTFDLAPNSNLPNPFTVAAPTSLVLASGTTHLYLRNDGTVFSRLFVSWTAPADAFVVNGGYIEIQYKLSSAGTWQDYGDVPGSSTSAYILDVDDGNSYDVRIRAVSAMGAKSDYLTATGHTVIGKTAPPSDVTGFTGTIQNIGIQFNWTPITDLDLKEYEVRIGTTSDTWASAAVAFRTRTDKFFYQYAVAGVYRARIKAVDTTGNYSLNDAFVDVTIISPGLVVGLRGWQVDNNVLLDWDVPTTGTLTVQKYEVKRGGVAGGGAVIGSVDGTFFTYMELVGATYYYTVSAIDIAGNRGSETSIPLQVAQPRDFYLHADNYLLSADATIVNAFSDGVPGIPSFDGGNGDLIIPVNTTETWTQHYTNNSFTTVQDFINAGYTEWIQPVGSALTGSAEWVEDLGVAIPEANLSFSFQFVGNGDNVSWAITLSYKTLVGDPWIDSVTTQNPISASTLATNFRYVRAKISVTSLTATGLGHFIDCRLLVGTKKQSDGGIVNVVAADAASGGTFVLFTHRFIDVLNVMGSPVASVWGAGKIVIINFTDTPYPIGFRLLLYDSNGNALSGSVAWTAEGLVSVSA